MLPLQGAEERGFHFNLRRCHWAEIYCSCRAINASWIFDFNFLFCVFEACKADIFQPEVKPRGMFPTDNRALHGRNKKHLSINRSQTLHQFISVFVYNSLGLSKKKEKSLIN